MTTPAVAPYRNLRVWIACFDLALDMFQISRRLRGHDARTMARRLIEVASRLPVSIARGQSSGSGSEFLRCLHQTLSDLSELETHLLICAELKHIAPEEVRTLAPRLQEIRRMTAALARRLKAGQGPAGPEGGRSQAAAPRPAGRVTRLDSEGRVLTTSRERGSALMMALVVSAALTAMGLAWLQIADVSLRTAARARDREALLHVAETGARAVKRWFDAPVSGPPSDATLARHLFLGRFDLRDASSFERSRRLIDLDGDPSTPPAAADGSPGRELYRQGRQVEAGFPHLDLFHKPWRGDAVTALLGTDEGPDLILQDEPGVVDLLDRLNASLLTSQSTTGRIERIEVHGPAMAGPIRLGMATVTVTASRYRRLVLADGIPVVPPGEEPDASAVVRMGLAEIPFNLPRGPMAACGDITVGGRLQARWGQVTAAGLITLPAAPAELDVSAGSGLPFASLRRRISGADLAAWESGPDSRVEDPWLRVLAGTGFAGWEALGDQPFPFDAARPADRDHSNLFQRVAGLGCPAPGYSDWKRLTETLLAGEPRVHYHAWDPATALFRENGTGPARSVRELTHGRQGIFFFDTADGLPPSGSNLTPPVVISGGDWSSTGFIYLNAESLRIDGATGSPRVLIPPGEPWDDADGDLIHDAGEMFLNLRYATTAMTGSTTDEFHRHPLSAGAAVAVSGSGEPYAGATTTSRDARGLPVAATVNLFGILYNAGDIVAEGAAVHSGSLVAGGSWTQTLAGADSPVIYFDDRIARGEWPPSEMEVPRTFVTFWQTQRP